MVNNIIYYLSLVVCFFSDLKKPILNNLSLCAAKGGRSPKRERGAGQKHGPAAAGEGAAGS